MHGMINRGLEAFVCSSYGSNEWNKIIACTGLESVHFEAMVNYDDFITENILRAICKMSGQKYCVILEKFGAFIVSKEGSPTVLKLLFLGGETYLDFLYSLEKIDSRVKFAIPSLEIPKFKLVVNSEVSFCLKVGYFKTNYENFFIGFLRAMAGHYDTTIEISHKNIRDRKTLGNEFEINIINPDWSHPCDMFVKIAC